MTHIQPPKFNPSDLQDEYKDTNLDYPTEGIPPITSDYMNLLFQLSKTMNKIYKIQFVLTSILANKDDPKKIEELVSNAMKEFYSE